MEIYCLQTSSGCMVLVDVSVASSFHHLLCAEDRFVHQYYKLYASDLLIDNLKPASLDVECGGFISVKIIAFSFLVLDVYFSCVSLSLGLKKYLVPCD